MKRLAALLPLMSTGAFAQCVMCFRTAAAQQSERARVLNAGILIMLVPPLVILGGFVLLLYKRSRTYADAGLRRRFRGSEPAQEVQSSRR